MRKNRATLKSVVKKIFNREKDTKEITIDGIRCSIHYFIEKGSANYELRYYKGVAAGNWLLRKVSPEMHLELLLDAKNFLDNER